MRKRKKRFLSDTIDIIIDIIMGAFDRIFDIFD